MLAQALEGLKTHEHEGTARVFDSFQAKRPARRMTVDAPDPWRAPVRSGGETWKTLAAVGFGVVITLLVIAVL